MILAGDVGGTKTVLAVYENGVGSLERIVEETVPSTGDSLDAIIASFVERHHVKGLTRACFGVPGAVVGGLALGLVEEFVVGYGSSTWRDAVAFAFLILVLLFRPEGIFGKVTTEKV